MEEQECEENSGQAERELLYHYTTQEGLLGIIEKKNIWASHIQYLNDKSEGQIFTKLLLDELNRRPTTEPDESPSNLRLLAQLMGLSDDEPENKLQFVDKEVLDLGLFAFSWIKAQDTFVTSFSERGDLLSQWRAYSSHSGGYSIGFTRSYLNSVGAHFLQSRKETFYHDPSPLVACRYCDKPERRIFEAPNRANRR